ncbi:MAG: efflux RND transporter periplasmic adaptor subunit [Planctomycetes bacterium]|nr:efflux RND transporter periplasmic adaptor subunit [Planctomycetota bacterium]
MKPMVFLSILPTFLLAGVLIFTGCERFSEGATPAKSSEAATSRDPAPARKDPEAKPEVRRASQEGRKTEPESTEPPVLVRLGSFLRGPISSLLRVHADLEAVDRANVYPELSGVVKEILHREGDEVKKGEPVVQLEDRERQLALEAKKILWEQAKSKVRLAELSAQELGETVKTKALGIEKAQLEFERVAELFGSSENQGGIISKEGYDTKRIAFEEAKVQHQAASIQAEKAQVDYSLSVQNEKQAKVDLDTAEYLLSRTVLSSPVGGSLTFLELKPGELVGPSTKAFSVMSSDKLEARLYVPQKELGRLARGQLVDIRCEVFPDKAFQGRIDVINPVVDPEKGMVRVIVKVEDPRAKGFLRPGMFVSGEVVLEIRENALLIPKKAVLYENKDPIIFLAQDGVARRYVVEQGFSSKDFIEALALIDASGAPLEEFPEQGALILMGHNNLKDGARVKAESGS